MSEVLVYGIPQGETERYTEEILACFQKTAKAEENIERVKAAAGAAGFHSFRVAGFVFGTRPDFTRVINKK